MTVENVVQRTAQVSFNIGIKIGTFLFNHVKSFESFILECMEDGVVEAVKKRPFMTKIFCHYIRKMCLNKYMTEEACFLALTEYLVMTITVKTRDTTVLTTLINDHKDEYEDLADYVYMHTGQKVKFMYSPIVLRAIHAGICGVFNIHIDDCYVIMYDDMFNKVSDIDRKCFALHEAGHLYYKHFDSIQREDTHQAFKGVHKIELEADDYAAYIVGRKNMRKALLNALARYNWFNRLCIRREMFERIRELKELDI